MKQLLFHSYLYYILYTKNEKTAELQKAKTTPSLHFPGKDVRNFVLNRKDPLLPKSCTFLSAREHRAMSVDVRLFSTSYVNLCRFSKDRVVDLIQVDLFD